MATLSSEHIRDLLYHADPNQRLVVTPILDQARQVAKAAIDVRLGSEFMLLRQTRIPGLFLDPPSGEAVTTARLSGEVEETVETTYVPIGQSFVLHPGQFVLAATLEYISIPRSLMAYVNGRSSWGRLGLNIATATLVGPGFKGAITFEMVNLGTVPIGLYPGVRIAQLVLHTLTEPEPEEGAYGGTDSKYLIPVGPEFSKVAQDADWALLTRFQARFSRATAVEDSVAQD
jgi:dCTP deaminase